MYRKICVLILSLGILVAAQQLAVEPKDNSPECLTAVQEMIKSIQKKNFAPLTKPLMYGGKGVNDFGSPLLCNNGTGYRYMVMHLLAENQNFTIGLCGPDQCSLADYKLIEPPIREALRKARPKDNSTDVMFVDPEVSVAKFGFGTLVGVSMLIFYVICTIIGTTIEYLEQDKALQTNEASVSTDPSSTVTAGNQESLLTEERPKRQSTFNKFFKCFSLITNCEKLFSSREGGDNNLDIFNAFRFFCIIWVVQAHEYKNRGPIASNVSDLKPIMQSDFIVVVMASIYSVDMFFFIGGLLFTYIFLSKLEKMKSFTAPAYIMAIIHRYLRLVPTYAFVLIFYWQLAVFMGSGPVWHLFIDKAKECDGMWWSNLLLIDNFVGGFTTKYCFGHGWYMSNDFQIFLVMPALVYIYHKNKMRGKITVLTLIIACLVYTYWLSDYYKFGMSLPVPGARLDFLQPYLDKFYYKPWTRSPPYLYGCLFGFFYRECIVYWRKQGEIQPKDMTTFQKWGNAIKENALVRWILYVAGLGLILYIVLVVRPLLVDPTKWSQFQCNLYNTFSRIGFVVGLSFIVTGWMFDKDSWARQFCSLKVFEVLGKLSFSAYLCHSTFLQYTSFSAESGYYYSHGNLSLSVISDTIITFIASLIIHVVVESSTATLETVFLMPSRPAQSKTKSIQEKA